MVTGVVLATSGAYLLLALIAKALIDALWQPEDRTATSAHIQEAALGGAAPRTAVQPRARHRKE
jgi:hypothetical protein